jgi:hypothetical protein
MAVDAAITLYVARFWSEGHREHYPRAPDQDNRAEKLTAGLTES